MEKMTIPRTKNRSRLSISHEDLRRARQTMSVNYMARHFGVSRSTIYRLLRKEGLIDAGQKS